MKEIVILTLLYISGVAMEVDYEFLQQSKQNYKKQKLLQRSFTTETNTLQNSSLYKNYIKIMYKDVSKIDLEYLSRTYDLVLEKCIAKKTICIFKYRGNMPREVLIKKIQHEEKNVKAVNKYEKYEIKAF